MKQASGKKKETAESLERDAPAQPEEGAMMTRAREKKIGAASGAKDEMERIHQKMDRGEKLNPHERGVYGAGIRWGKI